MELFHKYRPTSLDDLAGQPGVVKSLKKLLKDDNLPHALMLTGPSGVGKTSVARVLKTELGCSAADFCEINAASSRGIDTVREIDERMRMSPIGGKCRIYLLDECHQLSKKKGGDAQSALLKMLEDTPRHVYFMLATTHPSDLLPTIRSRCTEVKFSALPAKAMEGLILRVCKQEKVKLSEEVVDKLVEVSDGGARKCLVILQQIIGLEEEEQLECIQKSEAQHQSIELCRLLLNPRTKWEEVAKLVKELVKDEEPEDIRRMVLGYCSTVLLSGGKMADRAYFIIQAFRDNYFDTGKAGLAASCYEVFGQK